MRNYQDVDNPYDPDDIGVIFTLCVGYRGYATYKLEDHDDPSPPPPTQRKAPPTPPPRPQVLCRLGAQVGGRQVELCAVVRGSGRVAGHSERVDLRRLTHHALPPPPTRSPCSQAGTYQAGAKCVSCTAGSFAPAAGATFCRPCAAGSTSGLGASACYKLTRRHLVFSRVQVLAAHPT